MATYSFCESVAAGPRSPWHIRKLTDKGKKLGGGIDTPGLCGHPRVTYGWDLDVDINEFHLEKVTCKECLKIYRRATTPYVYGDAVRHSTLHGVVEVVQPQSEGMPKYHVRWTTGDLLFYTHDDLEDDDE